MLGTGVASSGPEEECAEVRGGAGMVGSKTGSLGNSSRGPM